MNIHGEKNVQREKCSAPMSSNRRRNLLSLKRGRYAGFFSIKFLLFFVCRKGRNKICYIRHIFSVFLKITPKFGRDLLRSLDGMGKVLHRICWSFQHTNRTNGTNRVWNINVQKLLHKMPLISFWTNGENSSRFNERINETINEH